ncbi:hypothetical protein [Nocardia sp. CDC160]|uniref:hypothetical protein n=1 Tax=Nocardia sp. CDC160 TaxID=3112166 RepID=UPI002DB93154|nr:hypothetical protein [Nocardia sp. CDC160]MEC3917909.1 hypothetical protein [Nocardia sp. CDC160]
MDGKLTMIELLSETDLPAGFTYPHEFARIVDLGLLDLEPWNILHGKVLELRYHGMRERYPDRQLVPFAARIDNDDVACWEHGSSEIVTVHDFAQPGWENRDTYPSFYDWLRKAVDDLIDFDS